MLYRYSEVFRSLLMGVDLVLVGAAWLLAYQVRFHAGIPAPLGVPRIEPYVQALVAILPIWFWLFRSHGLYEPRRTGSLLSEAGQLLRATAFGVAVLLALAFFYRDFSYSRGVVVLFSVLSPVMVLGLRVGLRVGLRQMRRRGYNLRYVVVVGGGPLAEETIERIHAHPEAGLRVRGVFTEGWGGARDRVRGVPILGGTSELKGYLGRQRVDQVIIALPRDESEQLDKVMADLDDEIVSVKLIPDLRNALSLRHSVEDLDGLPVINLREGPMVGWAAVQKRGFDLVVAGAILLVLAPLLGAIALAVWLTSGRPVVYHQERVGLDGRVFAMLKYRSMQPDAEGAHGSRVGEGGRPAAHASGRLAASPVPRRAAPALERGARRHEPGRSAARAAGLHRGLPRRDPRLHAAPPREGGTHGLGADPRLARQHVGPPAHRARRLLHPELVDRPRHPDPADDRLAGPARPERLLIGA